MDGKLKQFLPHLPLKFPLQTSHIQTKFDDKKRQLEDTILCIFWALNLKQNATKISTNRLYIEEK